MGTIIVLNGVSSAGKSSLAKALQEAADETFLIVAMDDFIGKVPAGRENDPKWFPVIRIDTADGPLPRIAMGPRGKLLLEAMREFVAKIAASGMSAIVDEVCEAEAINDYRSRTTDARLVIIKVEAPIAVIEQRERERGDRLIGLARDQAGFLHVGIEYDMTVDTSTDTPAGLAREILARLAG